MIFHEVCYHTKEIDCKTLSYLTIPRYQEEVKIRDILDKE
jgi:hypothetical protein